MTSECPITFHRRAILKTGLAASAAMALGIPVTSTAAAEAAKLDNDIAWHKGVCRFCGTGCGLQVGVRNGRVVATKGDPDAPVNRGLNCVKGYFNAKILYGKDRLTRPLMRMKDGKFDKNGRFEAVSWETALTEMTKQMKRAYKDKGPAGAPITLIPMRVCVWHPRWLASIRLSALTNRQTAMPILRKQTCSFSGGTIWPKLTLCFGRVLPIAV
mgnify:CR=1 FL=1